MKTGTPEAYELKEALKKEGIIIEEEEEKKGEKAKR